MSRTWFITGVNSGIGRQMTERLLAAGDSVAGTARDLDAMKDLKEAHGEKLWLAQLEITDVAAIRKVVDKAFADLGRIDVIVNNAAYGLLGPLEGLTDAQIDDQIGTNLVGPIHIVRAALPYLRAQDGGRIIQVSSYSGQAAHAGSSLYNASKWGVEGFAEAMMHELAPFNIGVTIVEPGGARTSFRKGVAAHISAPVSAYEGTPANAVYASLNNTSRQPNGDPGKMAQRIIESADQTPAPRRVLLGSDAYMVIRNALAERLADVEPQKESAASTDIVTA
jgi:NAD(P)-dependent dehydrogenase (short-subunit alcohol dehydrogenase family)